MSVHRPKRKVRQGYNAKASQAALRRPEPQKPKAPVQEATRLLRIEIPCYPGDPDTYPTLEATFKRHANNSWSVTQADPLIDWMTRVRHVSTIETWLRSQHYSFSWGPLVITKQKSPPKSGFTSTKAKPPDNVLPAEATAA